MTDLLYDCHAAVKTGTDPETAFAPVAARFRQIVQELDLAIDLGGRSCGKSGGACLRRIRSILCQPG